jgi:hypothetical protein
MVDMEWLAFFSFIAGGLMRRHWGGWLHPNRLYRALSMMLLSTLIAFLTVPNILFAFFCGAVLTCSWQFVQGHAWGQCMGSWVDRPLGLCVGLYLGAYLTPLAIIGAVWCIAFNSFAGCLMPIFGLLTPLPHLLADNLKRSGCLKTRQKATSLITPPVLVSLG